MGTLVSNLSDCSWYLIRERLDTLENCSKMFKNTLVTELPNDLINSFTGQNSIKTVSEMFAGTPITTIGDEALNDLVNVMDASGMFAGTQISSVQKNLLINLKNLTDVSRMFANTPIGYVDFVLPDKVEKANNLFEGCANVTGNIYLTDYISEMNSIFRDAGTAAAPVGDSTQPLIAYHSPMLRNFISAHKTSEPGELVEYREKGGVSNLFERINDIAGPYEDHITQKFYLKYKGANIDKIDLTKYAYVNNIYFEDATGIYRINSTYKMFEDDNLIAEDFILPSGIMAIGIDSNTFGNTTKKRRLSSLYLETDVSDIEFDAQDARAYVYMDESLRHNFWSLDYRHVYIIRCTRYK